MFEKIVLDRRVRTRGFVLINMPEKSAVNDVFGRPAILDQYEYYEDIGLIKPRERKITGEEE